MHITLPVDLHRYRGFRIEQGRYGWCVFGPQGDVHGNSHKSVERARETIDFLLDRFERP